MSCDHRLVGKCRMCLTIEAGTSFALGRDGESESRPWVLVARQYSILSSVHAWVVLDITPNGPDESTREEFEEQAPALERGWQRLAAMRGDS